MKKERSVDSEVNELFDGLLAKEDATKAATLVPGAGPIPDSAIPESKRPTVMAPAAEENIDSQSPTSPPPSSGTGAGTHKKAMAVLEKLTPPPMPKFEQPDGNSPPPPSMMRKISASDQPGRDHDQAARERAAREREALADQPLPKITLKVKLPEKAAEDLETTLKECIHLFAGMGIALPKLFEKAAGLKLDKKPLTPEEVNLVVLSCVMVY